jgi:hypothetical protein
MEGCMTDRGDVMRGEVRREGKVRRRGSVRRASTERRKTKKNLSCSFSLNDLPLG